MSDRLRARLLEPGMREAIRSARVVLDAEDQRWMMNEIERLEGVAESLRDERSELLGRVVGGKRLCVGCGAMKMAAAVSVCDGCGYWQFNAAGARVLDSVRAEGRTERTDP